MAERSEFFTVYIFFSISCYLIALYQIKDQQGSGIGL